MVHFGILNSSLNLFFKEKSKKYDILNAWIYTYLFGTNTVICTKWAYIVSNCKTVNKVEHLVSSHLFLLNRSVYKSQCPISFCIWSPPKKSTPLPHTQQKVHRSHKCRSFIALHCIALQWTYCPWHNETRLKNYIYFPTVTVYGKPNIHDTSSSGLSKIIFFHYPIWNVPWKCVNLYCMN